MDDNPHKSPSAVKEPKPLQPKFRKRLTVLEVYIVLAILAFQTAIVLPAVNAAHYGRRQPVILEGLPLDPETGGLSWSHFLGVIVPFALLTPLLPIAVLLVIRRPLRRRFPHWLPLTRGREERSVGQTRLTVVLDALLCTASVVGFFVLLWGLAHICQR